MNAARALPLSECGGSNSGFSCHQQECRPAQTEDWAMLRFIHEGHPLLLNCVEHAIWNMRAVALITDNAHPDRGIPAAQVADRA